MPANRPTIRDLLGLLDDALDALTAPVPAEAAEAPAPIVEHDEHTSSVAAGIDPLTAHQGDILDGGWKVCAGWAAAPPPSPCSARGRARRPEVLKVAKDEEYAERLRDEARALADLRHIGVVELFGVERIGGRTTLRLEQRAIPMTARASPSQTASPPRAALGSTYSTASATTSSKSVGVLESVGVPHRDIRPDKLGVRPRRGDRSLHLVLFDFSLARTPDRSIQAGTPGYLDPFLAERPCRRWDPAADRYAAAATLHEMATGSRPVWGDGRTDPLHLPDVTPLLDLSSSTPRCATRWWRSSTSRCTASRLPASRPPT